ncbi:glycerophosphodiester phosphodiesterase gdpdl3 [Phtheirospermum japonicum]|uniref:glycerophosphodiester phosphodiesterase n=1 Tax=Phtheirospermum japonicum TaxID=374723 RepID=A0A830D333_9LAMI|nr:glycerophosphodiester phosphodiesterase gdpdl3 [Phtheirospermum japonicum]
MWKLRSVFGLLCFVLLCSSAALVAGQRSNSTSSLWQTIHGDEPLVVARGGFSGIFPDSSGVAYSFAPQMSLPNTLLWCDVQLTRDEQGICFPDIRLENATDVSAVYPRRQSTYSVNNVPTTGFFAVDFTLAELERISLIQRIYSRAPNFDGQPIVTVLSVAFPPQVPGMPPQRPPMWLSIPYDTFFSQHNQSMRTYIPALLRNMTAAYISSPEVGFLRFMSSTANRRSRSAPKRVFQFLDRAAVEPTTNQTYGSLLTNLTLIRGFADGILVSKAYIWPVNTSQYLLNYTSLVVDAHRAGLEVFASGFANDVPIPFDYSYDPVSEYLSFIDNRQFAVDGVITDFPVTSSATIDCYAHMRRNDPILVNISVISNEGASTDYPGCTDLAYNKAVSDGVDVLDCPVQITSDGIPICLGSINLRDRTDAAQSDFLNRATDNPELNIVAGILTYNLTWEDIQSLRPAIYNPYGANYTLYRNPVARAEGNFMRLSDFLAYVNNQSSVSGVLITVENAAYLAVNQSLGVTDAVLSALSEAGYNNRTTKRVMIRSSDSAVLTYIKRSNNYELVYLVGEDVRDISDDTISDIKGFASSVVLSKKSIYPAESGFVTKETNVVEKLQDSGLRVFVEIFRNEFVSQSWDFFSDPSMELNTFVTGKGIDGVITDAPATANRYRRYNVNSTPSYMLPVPPGGLIQFMSALPPAEAPNPILTEELVSEPPLPPVAERPPTTNSSVSPTPAPPRGGQPTLVASTLLSGIAILLAAFVLLC